MMAWTISGARPLSQLYKETAPLNKGGVENKPSLIDEVGRGWRRWRELMWTP
jgi:hypothetical protein